MLVETILKENVRRQGILKENVLRKTIFKGNVLRKAILKENVLRRANLKETCFGRKLMLDYIICGKSEVLPCFTITKLTCSNIFLDMDIIFSSEVLRSSVLSMKLLQTFLYHTPEAGVK